MDPLQKVGSAAKDVGSVFAEVARHAAGGADVPGPPEIDEAEWNKMLAGDVEARGRQSERELEFEKSKLGQAKANLALTEASGRFTGSQADIEEIQSGFWKEAHTILGEIKKLDPNDPQKKEKLKSLNDTLQQVDTMLGRRGAYAGSQKLQKVSDDMTGEQITKYYPGATDPWDNPLDLKQHYTISRDAAGNTVFYPITPKVARGGLLEQLEQAHQIITSKDPSITPDQRAGAKAFWDQHQQGGTWRPRINADGTLDYELLPPTKGGVPTAPGNVAGVGGTREPKPLRTVSGGITAPMARDIQKERDAVSALEATVRVMQEDAVKAQTDKTGAIDVDLLMQHLKVTAGTVKGVRITQKVLDHAVEARSWTDDLKAEWQKITGGKFLVPEQRAEFIDIARRKLAAERDVLLKMERQVGAQSAEFTPPRDHPDWVRFQTNDTPPKTGSWDKQSILNKGWKLIQ